jgi:hypothetical protein
MERELLRALLNCGYGDLEFLKKIWDRMAAQKLIDEYEFAEEMSGLLHREFINFIIDACFQVIAKHIWHKWDLEEYGNWNSVIGYMAAGVDSRMWLTDAAKTLIKKDKEKTSALITVIENEIWSFVL